MRDLPAGRVVARDRDARFRVRVLGVRLHLRRATQPGLQPQRRAQRRRRGGRASRFRSANGQRRGAAAARVLRRSLARLSLATQRVDLPAGAVGGGTGASAGDTRTRRRDRRLASVVSREAKKIWAPRVSGAHLRRVRAYRPARAYPNVASSPQNASSSSSSWNVPISRLEGRRRPSDARADTERARRFESFLTGVSLRRGP